MAEQHIKSRRMPVRIGVQKTNYVQGEGATAEVELIKCKVGTDCDGDPVYTDVFYVEWQNLYGAAAIQLQQNGVVMPARVRLPYVAAVYEALRSKSVVIYKRGKIDAEHCYTPMSAPDDYGEKHEFIEIQVKHYEVI